MKRRDFLKLIGVAPLAPSVLAAAPIPLKELNYPPTNYQQQLDELVKMMWVDRPIGIALGNIPKDSYGWVRVGVGENGVPYAKPINQKDFYK